MSNPHREELEELSKFAFRALDMIEVKRLREKGIESDQVSREEAGRWLKAWHETGIPPIAGRRLLRAYLHALDMRDALERIITGEGRDEGITDDGFPYWIARRVMEEIQKFNGGGDGQER